jgi:MioC protein
LSKNVVILFGTESGNAEFAAEDMAAVITDRGVQIFDMSDFSSENFDSTNLYILICSTHGEGDLPSGAVPLYDSIKSLKPDLSDIEYAIFGLGDSSYENYSRGSEHFDTLLTSLGASRIGEYGRHDAQTGTLPNESAVKWTQEIIAQS